MTWHHLDFTELAIQREDYDTRVDYSSANALILTVNYRVHPASEDELAFGQLALPHARPEPWSPGELETWRGQWEQLVLDRFDRAFKLFVYTGYVPRHHTRQVGHRALADDPGRSSWALAREQDSDVDIVNCRLEFRQASGTDRVHLQVLAAKANPRAAPADTPYRDVGIAASGTSEDIDMVLFNGDLAPRAGAQARALTEFGRYLGCWSRGAEGAGDDRLGPGDPLLPSHGWPWWRRLADHVDGTEHDRVGFRSDVAVVVVRVTETGARSRAAELEDATSEGTDAEQRDALARDPEDTPFDDWWVIPVALVAVGLAVLLGVGVGAVIDEYT